MDDATLGLLLKGSEISGPRLRQASWRYRDHYRAIIARAPKYAGGYLNLSSISSELMKFTSPDEIPQLRAEAAKAASQALALDPTNGGAYFSLAMQCSKRTMGGTGGAVSPGYGSRAEQCGRAKQPRR